MLNLVTVDVEEGTSYYIHLAIDRKRAIELLHYHRTFREAKAKHATLTKLELSVEPLPLYTGLMHCDDEESDYANSENFDGSTWYRWHPQWVFEDLDLGLEDSILYVTSTGVQWGMYSPEIGDRAYSAMLPWNSIYKIARKRERDCEFDTLVTYEDV